MHIRNLSFFAKVKKTNFKSFVQTFIFSDQKSFLYLLFAGKFSLSFENHLVIVNRTLVAETCSEINQCKIFFKLQFCQEKVREAKRIWRLMIIGIWWWRQWRVSEIYSLDQKMPRNKLLCTNFKASEIQAALHGTFKSSNLRVGFFMMFSMGEFSLLLCI